MKYSAKKFLKGLCMLQAYQLKVGDAIAISDSKLFWIDDIDKFFINEEVSKLYDDTTEPSPAHTKYTFYDSYEKKITDIPYDAEFITYRLVEKS